MTTDTMELRDSLLGYVGGNREKLDHYLEPLSLCTKAYDVATRVIRPLFVNEGIDEKIVCQRAFYAPIAQLSPKKDGKPIVKADALYYHITLLLPKWKTERKEKWGKLMESEEFVDTVVELTPQGEIDVKIHIHVKHLPESLEELLKPFLQAHYAQLAPKKIKGFDARTDGTVMELACPLPLMPDFLLLLQEHAADVCVTYLSRYTKRPMITIGEALDTALTELDESDE